MASSPYIEELRLDSFKSFRGATLPLHDLTLLIGRNGSGKSNAIAPPHPGRAARHDLMRALAAYA